MEVELCYTIFGLGVYEERKGCHRRRRANIVARDDLDISATGTGTKAFKRHQTSSKGMTVGKHCHWESVGKYSRRHRHLG